MKAYFIMRKDLNVTSAKLAVQVGHDTQYIIDDAEVFKKLKRLQLYKGN